MIYISKKCKSIDALRNSYENGTLNVDNYLYTLPSLISHLDNDDLKTMFTNMLIMLPCIQDEIGCIHMNEKDFDRLLNFIDNNDNLSITEKRFAEGSENIMLLIMERQSDENSKKTFFNRIYDLK